MVIPANAGIYDNLTRYSTYLINENR